MILIRRFSKSLPINYTVEVRILAKDKKKAKDNNTNPTTNNENTVSGAASDEILGFAKAVPVILFAVAIFITLSFITDETGAFGGFVGAFLKGLFSYIAYTIPVFIAIHAVFFFSDLKNKRAISRLIFSLVTLLTMSLLAYVIPNMANEITFDAVKFYTDGMSNIGGGFIGSAFAYGLIKIFGKVGVIIITALMLILYVIFFFSRKGSAVSQFFFKVFSAVINFFAGMEKRSLEKKKKREEEKLEKIRIADDRKNADLFNDSFFYADNGVSKLEIPELGILETKDGAISETGFVLRDKVIHEDPSEAEDYTVEHEPEADEPYEEDSPLFERTESGREEYRSDDIIYEQKPTESAEKAAPTRNPYGLDDSAEAVFTADFDPFDLAVNEKRANKQSSRAATLNTNDANTFSESIANLTPEQVEKMRRLAEFEERRNEALQRKAMREQAEQRMAAEAKEREARIAEEERLAREAKEREEALIAEKIRLETEAKLREEARIAEEVQRRISEMQATAAYSTGAYAQKNESGSAASASANSPYRFVSGITSAPSNSSLGTSNTENNTPSYSNATNDTTPTSESYNTIAYSYKTEEYTPSYEHITVRDEERIDVNRSEDYDTSSDYSFSESDFITNDEATFSEPNKNISDESVDYISMSSSVDDSYYTSVSDADGGNYSNEYSGAHSDADAYTAYDDAYSVESEDSDESTELESESITVQRSKIESEIIFTDYEENIPQGLDFSDESENQGLIFDDDAEDSVQPEEIPEDERNPQINEYRSMFNIFSSEDSASENADEDSLAEEAEPADISDEIFTDIDEDDVSDTDDIDNDLEIEDEPPFEALTPAPEVKKEEKKVVRPDYSNYKFPPLSLLKEGQVEDTSQITEEIQRGADQLINTLESFGIKASVRGIERGPRITRYSIVPAKGVRVNQIEKLSDDLALALAAESIRIEAPIPGKSAVGIEVPNKTPSIVLLRDLLEGDEFVYQTSKTSVCIGKSVEGSLVYGDIGKMPHLLIAGATGMGKSVCMNALITSILYKAKPDEVKFIMIDPKKVEFAPYNGIPHLLIPVVTEPKQAAGALVWAVDEMNKRYDMIEKLCVRNIDSYNEKVAENPELGAHMPKIVIFIDELNDLMIQVRDPVENLIMLIAQKARAAGIHLVIGTQRPSVNVITGVIKANIPSRIACKVSSGVDSRTILEQVGAEKLIGKGDMMFSYDGKPTKRVQGAFVSEGETMAIIDFIKAQTKGETYDEQAMEDIRRAAQKCDKSKNGDDGEDDDDDSYGVGYLHDRKFLSAVELAINHGNVATSFLQRKLHIGYGKAAQYIDIMVDLGIVEEKGGAKGREVLISMAEWNEKLSRLTLDD